MKLFEYEAKELFRAFGIPTPRGVVVESPDDVRSAIEEIGLPVAIKAQVLVGGRGKEGGIRFADTIDEARIQTKFLLSQRIKGQKPTSVLIEAKVVRRNEYYVAMAIDQASGKLLAMFSTEGGVEIETTAKERPDVVVSERVSLSRGLFQFDIIRMIRELGLRDQILLKVSNIFHRLYELFIKYDGILAEINPLVITETGDACAVGAVFDIDNNSLFRHPDIRINLDARYEDETTKEMAKRGLSYVRLEGDIGVMGSGAGLTMATIDLIREAGCRSADFLETGGGITEQLMADALELLLRDKRLRAVFINLYGGINPMPEAARGIVKTWETHRLKIPLLVKLIGNGQVEAWEVLETARISVAKKIQTEEAVDTLVRMID
jgi:succinyl-CoA synthetase beta subunit